MSDFVYKSEKILKKDLYSRMKEILIEAGWKSIASKPSTEYDIFYSDGEGGGKEMYFQMKDFDRAGRNLSTTSYGEIAVRFPKSYTPSTTVGGAGIFERADAYKVIYIAPSSNLPPEAEITLNYHCNLNRLLMVIEIPVSLRASNLKDSFVMIGCSDRLFGKVYPKQECGFFVSRHSTPSAVSGIIADKPDDPQSASYPISTFDKADIKTLSSDDKVLFSQVAYGSASEGIRGIVDGIYVLKDATQTKFKYGDEFIDTEGKRYKIIETSGSGTYSSFSTNKLAFRIA